MSFNFQFYFFCVLENWNFSHNVSQKLKTKHQF